MIDYFGKNMDSIKEKKLFLFDMDGTIYLGNQLFEGVNELLVNIKKNGGKFVFITNNSSKSVIDYLKKLNRLGIYDIDEENFFTSSQATSLLLEKEYGGEVIYAQGTKSFIDELSKKFIVKTTYCDDAKIIVVGFDTELTFEKMENTCKMLNKGLPYYATNPDWVCPTEYGYVPDCGSMCQGYERATGRKPIFIGKPEPTMINIVMKKMGYGLKDTVVLGDRIYTDITAGYNAGVDTICVLSGEVNINDVNESEVKPTYVINCVNELNNILK